MTRVLLVGESWFTYSVHQKGFDAFYTSEYVEGGAGFIAALRDAGHDVSYIPSHEVAARFPRDAAALRDLTDVVVISDVGANTFQLAPETFGRSIPSPDKAEVVREFVSAGGGVVMVGGYLTFSGVDAKARWGRTSLAQALPVRILDIDDRVELPAGAEPTVLQQHPVVAGLEARWPALLGLNELVAKDGGLTLAECAGHPLLVVGEYEQGRAAAFASDIAPHWAPPGFTEWPGYQVVFDRLVRWVAGEDLAESPDLATRGDAR